MILPALVALLTAGGPLLRGSWDLWAQAALHLVVIAGMTAWGLSRIFIGYLPLPSNRVMVWTGLLALLSALSAWASPIHGLARGEWFNFLEGLWIFLAMAALTKDERTWIDQAIRLSAWVLMVLAFYQHFRLGVDRPTSALLNQNVYAGAVLMFLPLALERRDWLLFGGLLWSLWWTKSAGAWLGLASALAITQRRTHPFIARAGIAVVVVCAVILYGRIDTPEVLHRWGWWKAAWEMVADRPLTGYGPGAFAWVLPKYRELAPYGLYTLYAHQWYLEIAAGYGIVFALLWFGGIWRTALSEGHYKRFAVIAVMFHSLWDYTLSIPSNFWLFCYCAASAIPDSPRGINIPSPYKFISASLTLGLGLAFGGRVWSLWAAQSQAVAAQELLAEGRLEEARAFLDSSKRLNRLDPERALIAAAVELAEAAKPRPGLGEGPWLAAAAALEESVALNPFRPATWTQLASVYRVMGRGELALAVERRAQAFVPRTP